MRDVPSPFCKNPVHMWASLDDPNVGQWERIPSQAAMEMQTKGVTIFGANLKMNSINFT